MTQFNYAYQKKASPAIALADICAFLNDATPAAPGTGPAWTIVQVYDPNAVAPYEIPVAGLATNLAADNCFNPANIATGITVGAWIVYESSDGSHPFQIGMQFTATNNIRFVVGGDRNKAGANGGFDTAVQNSDITNSSSWTDGKLNTVDYGVTTVLNSCWMAVATESALALVFDDKQTPTMRIYVMGKMTGTTTGDNYPVVQYVAPDRVWSNNNDGLQGGSYWQRFSKVDESTVVNMSSKVSQYYSNDDRTQYDEMKDIVSNEWPILSIDLICATAGHYGQWGTVPLVHFSGAGISNGGYGRGNLKKNGVDYGYAFFKNGVSVDQTTIIIEGDETTDISAV